MWVYLYFMDKSAIMNEGNNKIYVTNMRFKYFKNVNCTYMEFKIHFLNNSIFIKRTWLKRSEQSNQIINYRAENKSRVTKVQVKGEKFKI